MQTVVLCAMLAAVLVPLRAGAQSLPITEQEALARLSPDSPRLRVIRSAIDVVRAEGLAAGRWPNPRVTFDRESVAGLTENMTMVSQLLPITGRRGFEMQAAAALVGASANRADDAMRRARTDLRLAFAQLVTAQVRERELTTAHDRLQELAEILSRREAAGDTAGFDRLRAEREVFDLDADRAAAATERARSQAAIAGFFADVMDSSLLVAADRTAAPSPIPPLPALVERAESVRGEVLALRQDLDAAHFSTRAADRRGVPEPEIVVGTKSSTAGGGDLGSVVTVQAVVPLFDHGRAERSLANARASQAAARLDAFRLALQTEIVTLRAAALERRDTAERYRATALNGAGEIARIAQVSYDAGERSILELLDAYRTASSARLRQSALDFAARQAEIELEFVSGWEIP